MAVTSVNDYYNQFMKTYDPKMKADIEQSNTAYLNQSNTIKDIYGQQIDDQSKQYQDLIDVSEAQRYIDEQRIAENMANMGLTDSGLNRTQQTAVQLSASNRANRIDMQRQSAVNALTQAMTAKLADIESARSSAEMGIRQNYENMATTAANNAYKTDVEAAQKAAELQQKMQYNQWKANLDAQTALAKAQINASAKGGTGLYSYLREDDNGYSVFRDSNGKEVKIAKGVNPYTGNNNTAYGNGTVTWDEIRNNNNASDAQKAAALYGVYGNGYQPKGVVYEGKHYGTMKGQAGTTNVTGKSQNVWITSGSTGVRYWLWSGDENRYVQIDKTAFDKDGTIKVI